MLLSRYVDFLTDYCNNDLSFASPDSQRLGHKKTTWFLAYMAENE